MYDWKSFERHPLSADYVNIDGEEWDKFVESLRLYGIVNDRRITMYEGKVLDGLNCAPGAGPVTCTLLGRTRSRYHAASPSILSR